MFIKPASGIYYRVLDLGKELESFLTQSKSRKYEYELNDIMSAMDTTFDSFTHSDAKVLAAERELKYYVDHLKEISKLMKPLLVIQITWNNMIHQDDPNTVYFIHELYFNFSRAINWNFLYQN